MTEVDHKVIEILGKDSMSVNGIGVDDTLESTEEEVFQLDAEISAVEYLMQNSEEIVALRSLTPAEVPQNTENQRANKKSKFNLVRFITETDAFFYRKIRTTNRYESTKSKKRKLQLEIDYLEKLNRKTELEILKLEKELGISTRS
jgi:hypothetical protein